MNSDNRLYTHSSMSESLAISSSRDTVGLWRFAVIAVFESRFCITNYNREAS